MSSDFREEISVSSSGTKRITAVRQVLRTARANIIIAHPMGNVYFNLGEESVNPPFQPMKTLGGSCPQNGDRSFAWDRGRFLGENHR